MIKHTYSIVDSTRARIFYYIIVCIIIYSMYGIYLCLYIEIPTRRHEGAVGRLLSATPLRPGTRPEGSTYGRERHINLVGNASKSSTGKVIRLKRAITRLDEKNGKKRSRRRRSYRGGPDGKKIQPRATFKFSGEWE